MSSNEAIMLYKAAFNGENRLGQLCVPLRFSDLHQKLQLSFRIARELEFVIHYNDEDGDVIVSTDECLKSASALASRRRKKYMMFSIEALKKPAMQVVMFAKSPHDSITDPTKQRCPHQEHVSIKPLTHFAPLIHIHPHSSFLIPAAMH